MRAERVLASVIAIAQVATVPSTEVSRRPSHAYVFVVGGRIAAPLFSGFADTARDACLERTRRTALRDVGRGRPEHRACPRLIEARP